MLWAAFTKAFFAFLRSAEFCVPQNNSFDPLSCLLVKDIKVSSNGLCLKRPMFKTVNNLNPSFMAEVFVTKDVPYNLRGSNNLALPRARTNLYGIDTIRFVGQKLWQTLPREIKESQSLEIFKRNIKTIRTFDCSCKLCKNFITNLGSL